MHRDDLVTDVELRLRTAGIKVLSQQEIGSTPGQPYLYVNINSIPLPQGSGFLYNIQVQLVLDCLVDRGEGIKLLYIMKRTPATIQAPDELFSFLFWIGRRSARATTWFNGALGRGGADTIRQSVRDRVDEFANDYLKENPKK